MRINNKKGFVLAEAIIVGTFVLTLFTFLFLNVVPLVGKYESIEKYDTINGAYNTNLIRTMILQDNNSKKILELGGSSYKNYTKETLCKEDVIENVNFCSTLLGEDFLNVRKIYITWFRTNKIKATSIDDYDTMDRATRDYIAHLPDYSTPAGDIYAQYKRIIVYYNDGSFANIEIKVAENNSNN